MPETLSNRDAVSPRYVSKLLDAMWTRSPAERQPPDVCVTCGIRFRSRGIQEGRVMCLSCYAHHLQRFITPSRCVGCGGVFARRSMVQNLCRHCDYAESLDTKAPAREETPTTDDGPAVRRWRPEPKPKAKVKRKAPKKPPKKPVPKPKAKRPTAWDKLDDPALGPN